MSWHGPAQSFGISARAYIWVKLTKMNTIERPTLKNRFTDTCLNVELLASRSE